MDIDKEYLETLSISELNEIMKKFVSQQNYEICCLIIDIRNEKKLKKLIK